MEKHLELKFKGERKYLHGSDFFNTLTQLSTELLGEAGFVEKLAFKSFAKNACVLIDSKPSDETFVAHIRLKSNTRALRKEYWIQETSDSVTESYVFDEDSLVAPANIDLDSQSIILKERSSFSPIEEIIALTKSLNYKVSPSISGKWVFGQLDLLKPLRDDYQVLHIEMKSLIKNRFSVNEIKLDDDSVGTMRFIVGSPS